MRSFSWYEQEETSVDPKRPYSWTCAFVQTGQNGLGRPFKASAWEVLHLHINNLWVLEGKHGDGEPSRLCPRDSFGGSITGRGAGTNMGFSACGSVFLSSGFPYQLTEQQSAHSYKHTHTHTHKMLLVWEENGIFCTTKCLTHRSPDGRLNFNFNLLSCVKKLRHTYRN